LKNAGILMLSQDLKYGDNRGLKEALEEVRPDSYQD
jgi:hypothetical protein